MQSSGINGLEAKSLMEKHDSPFAESEWVLTSGDDDGDAV